MRPIKFPVRYWKTMSLLSLIISTSTSYARIYVDSPLENPKGSASCEWEIFLMAEPLPMSFLRYLVFFNAHTGLGLNKINDDECLWKTEDGGMHWKKYFCVPNMHFHPFRVSDIQFQTLQEGWLMIKSSKEDPNAESLLHTQDGGKTWKKQRYLSNYRASWSFYFLNAKTGWLFDREDLSLDDQKDKPLFYTTQDGGENWIKIPSKYYIQNIWARSPTDIWAVDPLNILHSQDGGKQWQEVFSMSYQGPLFGSIYFLQPDYQVGWVTKTRTMDIGNLLFTQDGGRTWKARNGPPDVYSSIEYINATEGWADTWKGLHHTINGGKSWELAFQPQAEEQFSSQYLEDEKLLIAVGDKGTLATCTFKDSPNHYHIKQNTADLPPAQAARLRELRAKLKLNRQGIEVSDDYRPIKNEAQVKIPPKANIVRKAVAFLLASIKADGLKQLQQQLIDKYEMSSFLTAEEKEWLDNTQDNEFWRNCKKKSYEGAGALFWTLGYVSHLADPNKSCDKAHVLKLIQEKNLEQLVNGATLRPLSEILDRADLSYRYETEKQDIGCDSIPFPSNPTIDPNVMGYHYDAFEWLLDGFFIKK